MQNGHHNPRKNINTAFFRPRNSDNVNGCPVRASGKVKSKAGAPASSIPVPIAIFLFKQAGLPAISY
jgi:hypothetical protein